MSLITKGFGSQQTIIRQGYGGIFYFLESKVIVFKKELVDWAIKEKPTVEYGRGSIAYVFSITIRVVEFASYVREKLFSLAYSFPAIEKLFMDYVSIRREDFSKEFVRPVSVTGVSKESKYYEFFHEECNFGADHTEVVIEFLEIHDFVEL